MVPKNLTVSHSPTDQKARVGSHVPLATSRPRPRSFTTRSVVVRSPRTLPFSNRLDKAKDSATNGIGELWPAGWPERTANSPPLARTTPAGPRRRQRDWLHDCCQSEQKRGSPTNQKARVRSHIPLATPRPSPRSFTTSSVVVRSPRTLPFSNRLDKAKDSATNGIGELWPAGWPERTANSPPLARTTPAGPRRRQRDWLHDCCQSEQKRRSPTDQKARVRSGLR